MASAKVVCIFAVFCIYFNHVEGAQVRDSNELIRNSDTLTRFVALLADFGVVKEEDIRVYQKTSVSGRGARVENPLSQMVFDVFKIMVGEVLSQTLGTYLGVSPERTSDDFNLMTMIMSAVQKNTIQKRMGCP